MSRYPLPALLLGLTLLGCNKETPQPPVRPVLYVEVQPQSEQPLGRFAGLIQARYETTLGFRVGGRIAQRLVDVGTQVDKGTALAALDPTDQENALRASKGDLARSEAQWINAQANAQRQRELFDQGVGAKAQLEQAQVELSDARSARDQAAAAARQAEDRVDYGTLRSDFVGVVTAWHVEAGQVVSAGQDVVTLARPDVREAVFDLPAHLAEQVEHMQAGQGAPIRFDVAAQLSPDVRTLGTLRELEPKADAATRTRRVRLSLEHAPPELRLGSAVSITLSRAVDAHIPLPASAVQHVDGRDQVWVIDPQQRSVAPRTVQVVERQAERVEVTGDLAPGDKVVSAGVNELQAGQAVRFEPNTRNEDSPP